MSLTTAGAAKALIEGAGLGIAAYRDAAPPGAPLPYAVIQEGIALSNESSGDFGAAEGTGVPDEVREQFQVDLYQAKRNLREQTRTEHYRLPSLLRAALHGKVADTPTRSYPLVVRSGPVRLPPVAPNDDTSAGNLVRHTYTVELVRVA